MRRTAAKRPLLSESAVTDLQALLVFEGPSPEVAERFAAADPYVRNGLVRSWRVRSRTTVVGALASSPVRPAPAS